MLGRTVVKGEPARRTGNAQKRERGGRVQQKRGKTRRRGDTHSNGGNTNFWGGPTKGARKKRLRGTW